MSKTCSFCGSSAIPNMLTCSFCGSLLTDISLKEEMTAVDELVKSANQIAMKGDNDKLVRTFWISSFTPNSTAAGSKMIAQLLGLMSQEDAEDESDLMPRARAIVTHLKLSGEGTNLVQTRVIEEELDRVEKKRQDFQKKESRTTLLILGPGLLFFGILIAFILITDMSDDFPPSMVGSYSHEKTGPDLLITTSGISLETGESLSYAGDTKLENAAKVTVKDENNVQLTAVHGEWSSWSGYKTCSGGITRLGDKLLLTLSGDEFCQKFSGTWKTE
jgi:hypothetical protein